MAASVTHVSVSCDSSSETSDDEELQRLREAAVTSLDLPVTKSGKAPSSCGEALQSCPPSKRLSESNDQDDSNVLGTTPEFRAFLGKKLTEKLDREIVFCEPKASTASEYTSLVNASFLQEDVYLFANSAKPLLFSEDLTPPPPPPKRKRKISSSSSDSSEEERLASVAVTSDFIDQECAMLARLQPTPSSQQSDELVVSAVSSVTTHSTSKKKKKKKKKKKNAEDEHGGSFSSSQIETGKAATAKKKEKCEKDSACDSASEVNVKKTVNADTEHDDAGSLTKKKKKNKKRSLENGHSSGSADQSKDNDTDHNSHENKSDKKRKKKKKRNCENQ